MAKQKRQKLSYNLTSTTERDSRRKDERDGGIKEQEAGLAEKDSYLLERVEMRMEKDELGGHFVSTNCEGRLQKLSLGKESVL